MNLASFDFIVVNTSAGKDSQAMMDLVCAMAADQGCLDKVVAVHADLGQVEWKGTRELAQEQARAYGIRLDVVRREKGDLLSQVKARGMWPDNKNRFCTSDQKRDQVAKFLTAITTRYLASHGGGKAVRILNCMGFRADESTARAKRQRLSVNTRASNGKRVVIDWLPIHRWSVSQVWEVIKASGVRWHPAYDKGMPRLSCVFCVFAPKDALVIAGRENPELLAKYVALEAEIGHTFRHGFSIAEVQQAIAAGYQPKNVQSWTM